MNKRVQGDEPNYVSYRKLKNGKRNKGTTRNS